MFQLPAGYRPSQQIYFITQAVEFVGFGAPSNPSFGLGVIFTNGDVMIWTSGTGTADMFSLSNISFRVGA